MTWQLGSKPGVVDAIDKFGRPMEVPIPEAGVGEFGVDWDIDDDPLRVLEMLAYMLLGFGLVCVGGAISWAVQ